MNIQSSINKPAPGIRALSLIGVALCLSEVSLAQSNPPGPPFTTSVEVVNDASHPVPVTGSVDIGNQVDAVIVNDSSNPLPVSLSGSLDEHVVLRFQFDSGDVCSTFTGQGVGHLELPDRSIDPDPFVVPAGKALVISHLSWQAFNTGGFTQGEYLTVTVGTRFGALLRTGTVITSDIAAAVYANGNENIEGGLLFREGEAVCISGGTRTGAVTSSGPSLNGTVLSGRLVDQ